MNKRPAGLLYGLAAYISWGLFPIYWAAFGDIPPADVLAHRIIWSFVFVACLLAAAKRLKKLIHRPHPAKELQAYLLSSLLIGANWGIFLWACQIGQVLEVSLGYFICPLMNVLVGMFMFQEKLSARRWTAVGLSALGVSWMALRHGSVPWIALMLAVTFALYGAMRKRSRLESLEALLVECAVLLLPALIWIGFAEYGGSGSFLGGSASRRVLLLSCGVITAVPLIWFGIAARRLPMSTIGMLQYLAPTGHFLLAVFWFSEHYDSDKLVAFAFIWLALIVFSTERRKDSNPALIEAA